MVKIINDLKNLRIENDFERKRIQLMILEGLLGVISFIMSIINIITWQPILLTATAVTCALSFCNMFLIRRNKKSILYGMIFFAVKVFLLFTYFIVAGGTEGFSTIWLLLIPACSMFAFGRKQGAIMSAVLLLELVFFFYIPFGRSLLLTDSYTNAFLTRFPVVYIFFFSIGFYLETIREKTYNKLTDLHNTLEYLATHDHLTGLHNRSEFSKMFDEFLAKSDGDNVFALLILDIDYFKDINDTYGHLVGDDVLKEVAVRILNVIGDAKAFRWGGEEFAVLLSANRKEMFSIAENIRLSVQKPMRVDDQDRCVTLSIGCACSDEWNEPELKTMISCADDRLYIAKNLGRNRCCAEDIDN